MKNLCLLYERSAKEGLNWYESAHEFGSKVAEKYSISIEKVSAVVSAMSPGCNWEQNKKDAVSLIESFFNDNKRRFKFNTYGHNVLKAYRVLESKEEKIHSHFSERTGAKTYNFFYNIWQPDNADYVTIDRHAYAIATGEDYGSIHPALYKRIATHYTKAAKKLDILPNQLQSVLWIDHRNKLELNFKTFECPF